MPPQAKDQDLAVRWVKALDHSTRLGMLRQFVNAQAVGEHLSASQLASDLHVSVPHAYYHVRRLEDLGIIKLSRRRPVRGAVEHFYRLTDPPAAAAALEHVKGLSRSTRDAQATLSATELGQIIGRRRRKAGIDLTALARRAHITPHQLDLIEQGDADPSLSTVIALASALGIALQDLFEEASRMPHAD